MGKRGFRAGAAASQPASYPTLREFDSSRRRFLASLGAAALGAAGLGAFFSACGDRSVSDPEPQDLERRPPVHEAQGLAPAPDAREDHIPRHSGDGLSPLPDSRLDAGPVPRPDMKDTAGLAPSPDARIDPSED